MSDSLTRVERAIAVVTALALFGFVGLTVLTASFYMRLDRLEIRDACAGTSPAIFYDRTFRRNFPGIWRVSLWHLEQGEWVAWRSTSGEFDYTTGTPPRARNLLWLVNGAPEMGRPPVGIYRAKVTVTALPDSIISRSESIESNAFEVRSCT